MNAIHEALERDRQAAAGILPEQLTRRQKIKANRAARAEAYAKMTPEEQLAYAAKRQAKRAKSRARRKPNVNSRSYRWSNAVGNAREALERMQNAATDVQSALEDLGSIKEEFQEWLDNLDGKFAGSALVEKLETITQLDLEREPDFSDLESAIDEAENAELPMGFGRD